MKKTPKRQDGLVTKQFLKQHLDQKFEEFEKRQDGKREQERENEKKEILSELDKRREEDKKEILDGVKTLMEVRDDELDGKHKIELDTVAGKQSAPAPWKSVPRRLSTVEAEVEKIKDHLEIS